MKAVVLAAVLVVLAAGCSDDDTEPAAAPLAQPALADGEERDFPPGTLAVGDVLACVVDGIRAEAKVPEPPKWVSRTSAHAWMADGRTARLSLDVRPSGRVIASCSA